MALSGPATALMTRTPGVSPIAPISLSFWLNISASSGTNYFFTVNLTGSHQSFAWHYVPNGAGGFSVGCNLEIPSGSTYDFAPGGSQPPTGQWMHIGLTLDNGGTAGALTLAKAYLGGQHVGTDGTPGQTGYVSNDPSSFFQIGTGTVNGGAQIAYPAVWQGVILTPLQIANLAAGADPRSIQPTALVSYAQLNNATSVPDLVNTSLNWTASGGTFAVTADPYVIAPSPVAIQCIGVTQTTSQPASGTTIQITTTWASQSGNLLNVIIYSATQPTSVTDTAGNSFGAAVFQQHSTSTSRWVSVYAVLNANAAVTDTITITFASNPSGVAEISVSEFDAGTPGAKWTVKGDGGLTDFQDFPSNGNPQLPNPLVTSNQYDLLFFLPCMPGQFNFLSVINQFVQLGSAMWQTDQIFYRIVGATGSYPSPKAANSAFNSGNNFLAMLAFGVTVGNVWVSNGQQTGGSGSYSPGTQSVGYILSTFAGDGDTITLPAGTFDWGNATSAVTTTITKAIILQGVNPGSPGNTAPESAFTTILRNNNSNASNGNMITATAPLTGNIEIKWINFKQNADNSGGSGFALSLDRSDVSGGALVRTLFTCLVHDCFFDSNTFFSFSIKVNANGIIIWQCTFSNPGSGASQICGLECVCTKYGNTLDWNVPDTMGGGTTTFGVGDTASGYALAAGLNNSYIETCSFISAPGTGINCDSDSRTVIRDCYFQDSAITVHGGTSQYAVRHVEIYDNTFKNVNASALNVNYWLEHRSGPLIFTGNAIDNVTSKSSLIYFMENVNRSNYQSSSQLVYPASRQIGYGWSSAQSTAATSQAGTLTNGSNKVTGLNTSTLFKGQKVTGTNIPANTLIQFIDSATSIILTATATGSGSVTLTFTGVPFGCPPVLGANVFGSPSGADNFGYGQQLNPCYSWANTGTGVPTANNTFINPFATDNMGNNLTIPGTIYFNQQASNFSSGSVGSLAATFPGSQNGSVQYPGSWLNDLILCMVSWTTSGTPTVTVTDNASTTQTGTTVSGQSTVTGIDTSKIVIGMSVSGTNILATTVVSDILSDTSLVLSINATGSGTVTLTFTGNVYSQIGSTFNASTGVSQAIFAAINKSTTAAFTVTAHFSSNVAGLAMNVADYAGNWSSVTQLRTVTTDGSNQSASSSTTTMAPGNITTTNNSGGNDLIVVWSKTGSTPSGVTGGFTQQAYDGTNHFGFFDNVGSGGSAGSLSTPGTFGLSATTTAPWTASAVAFQSQPFLLSGRDYLFTATPSGWTRFTYPHPLTNQSVFSVSFTGTVSVSGHVNPTLVTSGLTSGLTAAADASLTRTILGATGGYSVPTNNYAALFSTAFGAAKAGATEWSVSGYARQAMGATGAGWSIAAYSSGVGVVWKNLNMVTFPAPGTSQSLASIGFCDALSAGNIDFFIDLAGTLTVPVGIHVVLPALTGAVFTTY